EDDDGVLSAELEMDALQCRCALFHDRAPGARFSDEADGLDITVLGQCLASHLTKAVDSVEDAPWQPGLMGDLDEQPRAIWTPLRRLVNDRATNRECGRDFPRRKHERRIPRGDHTDGANGPAHRVVDVVGRGERDTILRVWST